MVGQAAVEGQAACTPHLATCLHPLPLVPLWCLPSHSPSPLPPNYLSAPLALVSTRDMEHPAEPGSSSSWLQPQVQVGVRVMVRAAAASPAILYALPLHHASLPFGLCSPCSTHPVPCDPLTLHIPFPMIFPIHSFFHAFSLCSMHPFPHASPTPLFPVLPTGTAHPLPCVPFLNSPHSACPLSHTLYAAVSPVLPSAPSTPSSTLLFQASPACCMNHPGLVCSCSSCTWPIL